MGTQTKGLVCRNTQWVGLGLLVALFGFVAVAARGQDAPAVNQQDVTVEGEFVVLSDGYAVNATLKLPRGHTARFRQRGDVFEISHDTQWLPGGTVGLAFRPDGQTCFVASMQLGVETQLVQLSGADEEEHDGSEYIKASFNADAAVQAGLAADLCLRWVVDQSFVVRAADQASQNILIRSTVESVLTPRLIAEAKVKLEAEGEVEAKATVRVGNALAVALPATGEGTRVIESYCLDEDLRAPAGDEKTAYVGRPATHLQPALTYLTTTRFARRDVQEFLWNHQRRNEPRYRLLAIEDEYMDITEMHLLDLIDAWEGLSAAQRRLQLAMVIVLYKQQNDTEVLIAELQALLNDLPQP